MDAQRSGLDELIRIVSLKRTFILVIAVMTMSCSGVFGQEESDKAGEEPKNVLTLALAYTYIPAGSSLDNLQKGHFVPGLGIDYFREVRERFELGVMADIELGSYVIPRKEDLERERALVIALIGAFALREDLVVFLGPGYELEKHHSFPIFRVGAEYVHEFNETTFLPIGVFYDAKEGYGAWSVSIGYGMRF